MWWGHSDVHWIFFDFAKRKFHQDQSKQQSSMHCQAWRMFEASKLLIYNGTT
jgi:hypothetical protein